MGFRSGTSRVGCRVKRKHVALSHLDVIEVTWVDATSLPGWIPREEGEAVTPQEMRTVGYVLDASKQGITVSQSCVKDDDVSNVGEPLCIPRGCLTGVTVLRREK